MPLRNRVDPWGVLHAVDARGTLTGNRGILHDDTGRVVRDQRLRAWLACALAFRGRRRDVLPLPATAYTSLFLLDDATALAAGHRPCMECRRGRAVAWLAAWRRATGTARAVRVGELDRLLAAERRVPRSAPGEGKRAVRRRLGALPPGAMVDLDGRAWLVGDGVLRRWTWHGYDEERPLDGDRPAWVLTPATNLAALRGGYVPTVHPATEPPG